MNYEEKIAHIEGCVSPFEDILDEATEAMSFVYNLNKALRDHGAGHLPEDPDLDQLGNALDSVFGELAAVSLFLAEDTFKKVPDMLRGIASGFEKEDVSFTDEEGVTGPSVPPVVVNGFRQLAKRIEAARKQQQDVLAALQKNSKRP